MGSEVEHQDGQKTARQGTAAGVAEVAVESGFGTAFTASSGRLLSRAQVVGLQRATGNAAVAGMLGRRALQANTPVVARQPPTTPAAATPAAPTSADQGHQRAVDWSHGWVAGVLRDIDALPATELKQLEDHAHDADVQADRLAVMLSAAGMKRLGGAHDWQLRDIYRQMQSMSMPEDQQQEVATFVGAFGLFTPKAINAYVKDVGDIFANWNDLTTAEQRAGNFGYLVNRQLGIQGVPPVAVVVEAIATGGSFDAETWTMTISTRLGRLDLTAAEQSDFIRRAAATFLHEARHAEQMFTMARARSGSGRAPAAVVAELKIPERIAGLAAQAKLAPDSAEAKAAVSWYESEFGAGKPHREEVLGDLANRNDEYKALPEEADAHALGVAVNDRLQGGVPVAPTPGPGADGGLPGGVQRQVLVSRDKEPDTLEAAIAAKDPDALKKFRPFPALVPQQLWDICDAVLKNVWVGPDDERTLEEAWKAYRPPTLTAADYAYWKKCEDRGAEVRYVPWLYELQTTFAERTRDLALRNMEKNGVFIRNEAKRLGLGVDGAAAAPPTQESDELIAKQREAAFAIKDAKDVLQKLRTIPVGHPIPPWGTGSPPAGDQKTTEIATFDPAAPPYERPRPGEAMGSYETVMAMHQNINSQINTIANANPAIYALMATGNTDALVGADLTEVRAALTAGLLKVLDNITKTTAAINSGDLGWQDLQPVHQRLFESDPTYQKPFEQAAARGYVEEESGNADNASTLMTVAVMALIAAVEIGSAGTASPMVAAVIGLTASTATAADSWQQWSKLETAAQSTVSDSTAVVSKDQVDAASLKAIVDTAFALLDVFGLGKAARSAASVAKVASFEASLAARTAMRGLAALSAAERLTVLRKAIGERGIAAVLRETGQTAKELIELVGEQSDVGRQLLTFAAAGARGAEEIATKLPVLKTLAGTEAAAVVESAIDLIGPAEALRRAGGWAGVTAAVGAEAAAVQRLDNWRGVVARETEAALAQAGEMAPDLAKGTARSILAQRSGLAESAVEMLLGLEITMLADQLGSADSGGFQVGGMQATLDLDAIQRDDVQLSVQRVPPAGAATAALSGFTGDTFELISEQALVAGVFRDHGIPTMPFVVPGHYNGSGWGVDRIGFAMDGSRVRIYQIEMKYVSPTSGHLVQLGGSQHGAQTGLDWTQNAAEQLLRSDNAVAAASRDRLRAVLRRLYGRDDAELMKRVLLTKLPKAQVVIITPFYAALSMLGAQVGGLIAHGRAVTIVRARPR